MGADTVRVPASSASVTPADSITRVVLPETCLLLQVSKPTRLKTHPTAAERQNHLQCGAVITRSIFSKILSETPHSSPVRARYGVFVVILKSDSISATGKLDRVITALDCIAIWFYLNASANCKDCRTADWILPNFCICYHILCAL